MPIYEYRHKKPPTGCEDPFEALIMGDQKELKTCPTCGKPVERLLSRFSSASVDGTLSDKNLKDKGFSKLVNEGGGKFRKVV